jgi:hypothetical protein
MLRYCGQKLREFKQAAAVTQRVLARIPVPFAAGLKSASQSLEMRNILKESGHLLRMALLLGTALVLFLLIRRAVVPKSFGQYEHYRGAALDEIRARPVSFAGRQVCETCHTDTAETKSKGPHAGVGCEACHGPAAAHAEDPTGHPAMKPDPSVLCVRCHEANPAKPQSFPQVVSKDHANGMSCGACHQAHSPKIG